MENFVKKQLGCSLPCIDKEYIHQTHRKWVFRKLCTIKISPSTRHFHLPCTATTCWW